MFYEIHFGLRVTEEFYFFRLLEQNERLIDALVRI